MAIKSCGYSFDSWKDELTVRTGAMLGGLSAELLLEETTSEAAKKVAKLVPVLCAVVEQVHKAKSMKEYHEKLKEGIIKIENEIKELKIDKDSDEYKEISQILKNLNTYADNHQYLDGEWRNELFEKAGTDFIVNAVMAPIKGIVLLFGIVEVKNDLDARMDLLLEELNDKSKQHNHPKITGGAFGDRVNGCNNPNGIDHLYGEIGGDIVTGYSGEDHIYGQEGKDLLFGGEGDDFIYGGSDDDEIFGDKIINPDEYFFDKSLNPFVVMDPYSINYDIFDPETNGNPTHDSGNDLLCGELGNDKIYGNYGDDVIYGDYKGTDAIRVISSFGSYVKQRFVDVEGYDEIFGGIGRDIVDGGGGVDIIYGGEGSDTIYGGLGADVIYGEDNDDTIHGGSVVKFESIDDNGYIIGIRGFTGLIIGNDGTIEYDIERIVASGGGTGFEQPNINEFKFDKIITIGDYTIIEHDKKQIIVDKANEQITFSDLGVFVNHSAGEAKKANIYHDKIYGGKGRDTISGGIGSDYIDGGEDIARDYISGGDGNDLIYGGSGSDILYGNDGQDIIYGGNHNDYIYGGLGSDHLHGGHGEDAIRGYETVNLKLIGDAGYLMRLDANTFMVLYKDGTYKLAQTSNYINQNNEISFDQVHTNADGDRVLLTYKDIQVQINTKLSTAIIDDKTGDNFYGGEHDDKLYGGRGDDTYYYNKGDGHDTVSDANGDDRIVFGDGIYSKDITLSQNGDYTNQSVQSI